MNHQYVKINDKSPTYLQYEDGIPYIPVGMNICFQRFPKDHEDTIKYYDEYFEKFSENGGNLVRIWLGAPCFFLESKYGQYDAAALDRLKRLVALAKKYSIKLKFTFDHFRRMDDLEEMEIFPGAAKFSRSLYLKSQGGPCENMTDYYTNPESKQNFIKKLELLADCFAESTAIFGWELWNEVNAVAVPEEVWVQWTEEMLVELKRLFPNHFALQSLGSFCTLSHQYRYNWLCTLDGNELNQAHRYLDPGAELDVCRGPMDIINADVIKELLDKNPGKPAFLAEGGAVEWRHCRKSHLYQLDHEGMLLHDVLFAPFFAGSAGCGHNWHWEFYVNENNLWWHFNRFVKATEILNPLAEDFKPFFRDSFLLRLYGLSGKKTTAIWCRDKNNTWERELDRGAKPTVISNHNIDIRALHLIPQDVTECMAYSPWDDKFINVEINGNEITIPDFKRSVVLYFKHK